MKLLFTLPAAALVLSSCQPLGGTDPLDSGELAREASDISTSMERRDESRLQDERFDRYDVNGLQVVDPDPELRAFGGADARSDF